MNTLHPVPEHRFSFGLSPVRHQGWDPAGDAIRPPIEPHEFVHRLAEVGTWGVSFDDDDLVPLASDPIERDGAVERLRHALDSTGMVVSMAFNYGGRAELVDAVRAMIDEGVPASKVNEKAIGAHLYDPKMPDPELVIRTSGEIRTSNFLMWQAAYSELVFTETLWPDFRREHLYDCIAEYQQRDRRFGGLTPVDTDVEAG